MAGKEKPEEVKGTAFVRLKKSAPPKGGRRRVGPRARCEPDGDIAFNVDASEEFQILLKERDPELKPFHVSYGVNMELGAISIYPEKTTEPNTVAPTKNRAGYYSFDASAVYDDYPTLKPATRVRSHVYRSVDAENVPCMVVLVRAGQETHANRRKSSSTSGDKK